MSNTRTQAPSGRPDRWPTEHDFLRTRSRAHLGEVVDLLADAFAQDDEHGHGHLHVALLGVVAQHLLHHGAEEPRRQVGAEQRLGDGDEREGLDGREAHALRLVAAHVRGVGLVLEVLRGRGVVHDLVPQGEGLLGQGVLGLLRWAWEERVTEPSRTHY